MDKLPDTPLLLSGTIGGPLVIWTCTPLRNALTLGSQDAKSSARGLFKKVFRGGLKSGWTGGAAPAVVACPQFFCLGPIYHSVNNYSRSFMGIEEGHGHALLPSLLAGFAAGLSETLLTFGSQSRNAQMAYNQSFVNFSSVAPGMRTSVPLNNPYTLWGVGAGAMCIRNVISVMGVRCFSPWLKDRLPSGPLGENSRAAMCDMLASMTSSLVSAPVHQLFNFMATTPEARNLPLKDRLDLTRKFLNRQYFVPLPAENSFDFGFADPKEPASKAALEPKYSWRLSSVAARDLGMRAVYVSAVYTMFISLERFFCAVMRD